MVEVVVSRYSFLTLLRVSRFGFVLHNALWSTNPNLDTLNKVKKEYRAIDVKLCLALMSMLKTAGDVARVVRIEVEKLQRHRAKHDKILSGREVIAIIFESFRSSDNADVMFMIDNLINVKYPGDSKIYDFYTQWHAILEGMRAEDVPPKRTLRDILYKKIRDAPTNACPRYGQADVRGKVRYLSRGDVQRLKNGVRDALQVLQVFDKAFAGKAGLSEQARRRSSWKVVDPVDLVYGWDLQVPVKRKELLDMAVMLKPDLVTLAPPCGWSSWTQLCKGPEGLWERRRLQLTLWKLSKDVWAAQDEGGRLVLLEQPALSEALNLEYMKAREHVVKAVVAQCAFGLGPREWEAASEVDLPGCQLQRDGGQAFAVSLL